MLTTVILSPSLPLYSLFSFNTTAINLLYHLYLSYLRTHAPSLHSHFSPPSPLTCSLYLFEWLATCFSTVFPHSHWPHLFTYLLEKHSEGGFLRVALALSLLIDTGGVQQAVEVVSVRVKQVKVCVEEAGGWEAVREVMEERVEIQGWKEVKDRMAKDKGISYII